MRSGIIVLPNGTQVFDGFKFFNQIQKKEIRVIDTHHKSIAKVVHTDGFEEYVFWDEAGLAGPGGTTFDEALEQLNRYEHYIKG